MKLYMVSRFMQLKHITTVVLHENASRYSQPASKLIRESKQFQFLGSSQLQ